MKKRILHSLVLALALCFGPSIVYAGYPPTLSANRLPRENWKYDALAMLAAHGMVPGKQARHFYGDWLYTRREMAEFVASAVRELAQAPGEHRTGRSLVARLVQEFRPELDSIGLSQTEIDAALRGADQKQLATLAVGARYFDVVSGADGGETDIFADRETLMWSRAAKAPLVVLGLSNQRKEFRAVPEEFPYVQTAIAQGSWHGWDMKLGQEYLWWGPAYSGSLILSDNAPAFPFFQIGKDFSLGRAIGRLRIDQLFGTFEDGGQRFYFAGRRFEKTLSDQWGLAINETAKMADRPNPLILILPFYLYEHIFIEDVDEEFNYLASFEVNYRFRQNSSAYGELLIDDITAPSFFTSLPDHRPRRLGWLLGMYHPFSPATSLRLEYIETDPETYLSARPQLPQMSYTHDGFFIGHQVGPNSRAIFGRAEQRLSPNLDAVVEYLWRNPKNSAGFNPDDEQSYDAFLSYGIKPATALWLRAQRFLVPSAENRLLVGLSHTF